ncbi:thiol reductase thioredoxin [Neobacillus piezotolerans]|uniref:Thiol reductase thioredoxin n=1 Tax=Neobacillus piezotolerans TaxID=2259171 RepID=A0A3D8GL88_9BACI|nr:thioredoxin family protein [Neobacillus piezotolerans]RDU35230.1 thiol reductase thioredoxin [Neobacillus piezotolerans]
MKKVLIFLGVVVLLFIGTAYLTNKQNEEKASGKNPYGDKQLYPETIAQLDDPNYQNIITLDNLEKKLANQEDLTVYFYSPTCPHCKKVTPILMPLAKKLGVDILQLNVLEYDSAWDEFAIEGTPTLVRFENGKETARIVGEQDKGRFQEWLEENAKE